MLLSLLLYYCCAHAVQCTAALNVARNAEPCTSKNAEAKAEAEGFYSNY